MGQLRLTLTDINGQPMAIAIVDADLVANAEAGGTSYATLDVYEWVPRSLRDLASMTGGASVFPTQLRLEIASVAPAKVSGPEDPIPPGPGATPAGPPFRTLLDPERRL